MFVIKFLILYLPLQEFILKWLPTSDGMHVALRQIPNLLLLVAIGLCVLRKTSGTKKGWRLIGSRVDVVLLLFVVSSCISLAFSPSDNLTLSLVNLGVLLRYVLLVYLILFIKPSSAQMQKLLSLVLFSVFIQALFGIAQFLGGLPVKEILAARNVEFSGISSTFTGSRSDDVNDLIGTMGNTISFGYFILVGLIVAFTRTKFSRFGYWFVVGASLVLIYLSGSRAIFLAALGVIILHQAWVRGAARTTVMIIVGVLIIVPVVLIVPSQSVYDQKPGGIQLGKVFTSEYIENAKSQRLGLAIYVLPNVLNTRYAFFGYGPDRVAFAEHADINMEGIPQILIAVIPDVLEDVYWIALIVYYGVVGAFLWVCFIFLTGLKVYKMAALDRNRWRNPYAEMASWLFVIAIPLNFLNQAFDTSSFSFFIWLFAGMAIVQSRNSDARVRRIAQ